MEVELRRWERCSRCPYKCALYSVRYVESNIRYDYHYDNINVKLQVEYKELNLIHIKYSGKKNITMKTFSLTTLYTE